MHMETNEEMDRKEFIEVTGRISRITKVNETKDPLTECLGDVSLWKLTCKYCHFLIVHLHFLWRVLTHAPLLKLNTTNEVDHRNHPLFLLGKPSWILVLCCHHIFAVWKLLVKKWGLDQCLGMLQLHPCSYPACFKIDIYQLKLMCLGISQLNGFTLFGIGLEAHAQSRWKPN